MLKKFERNTTGTDYFVGDIHGCFYKLQDAMNEIKFNESTDRIFSVGDLVDRGIESHLCLEWLQKPFFHAVKGNHEDMAIRWPNGNMDGDRYRRNGGGWMIDLPRERQLEISAALADLPTLMEVDTHVGQLGVVHAEPLLNDWGVTANAVQTRDVLESLMWGRDKIMTKDPTVVSGIDFVVVGHTPLRYPYALGNTIYIDTGACFGNPITLVSAKEILGIYGRGHHE